MSSIDERVVELKFNNAQFETAVQQSLTTLGNLKNALSFGVSGAAKGLSGLSNVGSKLGNMGLNTVSSALESVTSKFSVLGTIGDQALRRITDSALSMGKNLLTAIPNQIIEGGKRRSQNLEQAKFQLNGLKIAWEDVSKSIDEAVGGTAYGMDEAAKACSQFAASGVKLGDDMTTALTAISGVAAMTNSSYDDTARIFTTVAGQGRLMGDQLNQLASRGLNVAATLGKALGKSEKEIREMVSKGKIDFKTFAEVMNKEFGEHAKDAGATFTGALSNVKAALSRMGEGFATPTYDALRRTFNELIPVLKQVEVLIKPLAGAFEVVADAAATAAEYGLKQLLGQLQKIVPQVDNAKSVMADKGKAYMEKVLKDIGVYQWLADKTNKSAKQVVDLAGKTFMTGGDIMKGIVLGSDEAQEAFKELRTQAEVTDQVVQDVINGKYGTGEERKRRLTEEFGSWEAIQNKVNETLGCSKRYEVSQKENTEKTIELAAETKEVAENTKKTEESVSKIRVQKLLTGLAGIKSALNIIKTASSAIFKDIVRPLIGWAAPKVLDGFLSIFSAIGSSLTKFDAWSSKNNFFEGITSRINRFATAGGSKLGEFLDKVKNLQGVKDLAAAFKNLGESLKNFGGDAVDKIAGLFDSLISGVEKFDSSKTDGITNFIDVLSSLGSRTINNVSSFIKQFDTFAAIVTKLEGVRHLTESLIKLKDAIFGFFSDKLGSLTDWLSGFLGTGEEFDIRTWSNVYRTISKVADGIANFIDGVLSGTNPLGGFTKFVDKIVGLFDSLISGVENFDSSKTDGITNFINVLLSLGSGAIKNVSSFIKQFNTFAAIVTKLEGVRHLTESLTKLKDAIFGFFSDKLESLTDWLSGFLGTGEEFDVRTWSDVYRTISKVADGIADFIDSILAGTNPLTVFTKFVDKLVGLIDSLISGVENFDSSKTDGITNFINVLLSLGSGAIKNVSSFIKQFNTFVAIVTKLEGVRHLTESLTKLKDAIFGFFSDKLESLTDWLSGFLGTGEEFDVRTWSDVYRTISKVADGIADFIDSILAGTNPLTVFTKSIGEFLGGFGSGILNDIRLFFAILSGKKFEGDIGTFTPMIKALLRNLSALFSYLKNIKKVGIGTIFKELFSFKGFDPSKMIAKVKAVIMKIMKTIGTGFNIGKSIFTGLMNGLKAIDFKALLTLGGLVGIGKKIYDFFHQFSNATLEIKKIPKNANKILNNLAGTLAAYRDKIRADSLIKVAFAIGILVGALALLTNFVDMNKLAQASADFFVIGVALAAVVAAFALFQKMRNAMPKKEETDEVKEAAEGVSEAIEKVTNSFTASLDKFVGGLNDFLANISKGIAQAAKFAGIGVMLVGFGVAVLLIVVSLKKLEDYDWEKGRESALALLAIAGTLIIAAVILSRFADSFNASTGIGLLAMAAAVFVLLEAVKSIGKVDPAEIQQGYGCVVILLAMIALIGHVTSAGAGSVIGLAVAMLILAGAMMALLVPIKECSTVPFDTIAGGVFKLAYSLLFIGGLAALISKLADLKGAAAILILAGAIMVMTPAVMLLGTVGLASVAGITVLCVALLALIGIGALGKLTASGLLMLAGGIAAIGGSLLAISGALIGFGASLFVITAGLNFMFAMLPSLLDNILAFGEYLLGGLKAIGLSVLSWIQSIGPKILPFINGIMVGIGGFLVNQVGPMVSSFFGTAIDVISAAVPVIGGFLKSTVGNIASGVGANIKASAGSLREAFADVIDRIMLRVLTKINEIVPDFVKDFLGIGDKLQTAINETSERIELREEKAREAVEPYTEGVEKQMDETVDAVEEGTKKVNEAAEGVEVDTSKTAEEAKKQVEEVTKTYGDAAEKTQEEIKKIFDFDSIASEMGIDLTGSADSIIGAFKNTFTSGLADNGEVKNSLGNFLNIFTSPDQAGVDMEAGGKSFFSDFIKGFTSGGDDGGSSTSGILNALIGPLQDPSSAGFDITSIGKNLGIPIPSAMAEGVTENADQPANAIESMFGSLLKGGGGGFDIASAAKNIGIEFPTSLASGITDNSSEATGSANELIEQVISQADSSIDSGNVDNLGTKVTTGFASGIKSGMGTCKAAVTALALASLAAIAAKVPLFKPYGVSAGTYYALGILSKKSAATAAGSSIASASVNGAKSKNASAKGAGIGLGDKIVDGVKSREDAAYKAGARLAEKAIQGFKNKWKNNDPTKELSNIAPTGNSPGVVKASKDAYSAGSKIGGGAVEGLKKAVEIARDILEEGIDINPTITPVLDLSQIRDGVGAINGLISPSTVNLGRLNASINASRGSDDKVIDAINSLKAGMKPTGDTYIIEGITYDDGSNVSDAVRTLVTAARKKRRA